MSPIGFSTLGSQTQPWSGLVVFIAASALMIWRLGAMEKKGFAGTVLGTLIMPYCSGFSNLSFAYLLGRGGGSGALVLENCLVNNTTNLTLLLGLPAIFWSLNLRSGVKNARRLQPAQRLSYLSLLFTLLAMLFFSGALWALGRDGRLDFNDGLVLVGIFVFWQLFHVFEVLKNSVRRNRPLARTVVWDLGLIAAAGYGAFLGIEGLMEWIGRSGSGLLVMDNLGWLSGLLMVLPNALLALYYAARGRTDIVYSSQVGDGHICIPMCIGLFALFAPIRIPDYFHLGVFIILGAGLVHLGSIAFLHRLPRLLGVGLIAAYGYFIYHGLIG